MKRILLSLIVSLTSVISVLLLNGLTVYAITSDTPTVTVESAYALAGSDVSVSVYIKNNPGIAGAKFTVTYDNALTLTNAADGDAFGVLDYTSPSSYNSPCSFNWDSEYAVSAKDGALLTLTFKVSENAQTGGTLPISISYRYGDVYDVNLNSLTVLFENGEVDVIDYIPGDVNNDSVVNGKDVTLIRRYCAGGYGVSINETVADVNHDGAVNGKDVTLIRRYNAGWYDKEGQNVFFVKKIINSDGDNNSTNTDEQGYDDRLDQLEASINNSSLLLYGTPFFTNVAKAGVATTFPVSIEQGTKIYASVSNVNSNDAVNLIIFNSNGDSLGGIINNVTKDTTVSYDCPQGVSAVRITGHNINDVTVNLSYRHYLGGISNEIDNINGIISDISDEISNVHTETYGSIDSYFGDLTVPKIASVVDGQRLLSNINNGRIERWGGDDGTTVHDSKLAVVNGIAYVVYASNTAVSDNAGSPTCTVRLRKIDLSSKNTIDNVLVAGTGTFENIVITGGAGQPNIVKDVSNNDLLHIIFTANVSGYTVCTCDYSITSGELSNYRQVLAYNADNVSANLSNSGINTLFETNYRDNVYISQQCNADTVYYNGYYYIGFCVTNGVAVIFRTTDFTNWYYFSDFGKFGISTMCELAIAEQNGYIIGAVRPIQDREGSSPTNATYGIIAKWGINSDNKVVCKEYVRYKNCSTKPSFFKYNNELYLFTNPYDRSWCEIIKIDAAELKASKLLYQFYRPSFHYASFDIHNEKLVVSSSSDGIELCEFDFAAPSNYSVLAEKIAALLK